MSCGSSNKIQWAERKKIFATQANHMFEMRNLFNIPKIFDLKESVVIYIF